MNRDLIDFESKMTTETRLDALVIVDSMGIDNKPTINEFMNFLHDRITELKVIKSKRGVDIA